MRTSCLALPRLALRTKADVTQQTAAFDVLRAASADADICGLEISRYTYRCAER